jgi:hypothetical protein
LLNIKISVHKADNNICHLVQKINHVRNRVTSPIMSFRFKADEEYVPLHLHHLSYSFKAVIHLATSNMADNSVETRESDGGHVS